MRLELKDVFESGVAVLDSGITDIKVAVIDGVVQIYSTTGRNGGVTAYQLDAQGNVTLATTVIFPPEITLSVGDKLIFSQTSAGQVLYIGDNARGLFGLSAEAGGLGEVTDSDWGLLQAMSNGGSIAVSEAMVLLSDQAPDLFPVGFDCTQIVDMISATVDGQQFVFTACSETNQISAFLIDPDTGALTATGVMGAAKGLGIDAPTALDVATINGQTYVIVGSAGTSSISVLKVLPDGRLLPVDHVLDNGTTRFEGLQDLAIAQSGDHTFVVAGGADNGLSLYVLMPDGSLVHMQTIADSGATSMHKVTSIDVAVEGDALHVFVGSQNESGLTHFTLDLSALGELQSGTNAVETLTGGSGDDILMAVGAGDRLIGGAGADILVAGDDQTRMTGGAGADTFVMRQGSGASTITDFLRGIDSLDLTDLPMLRDVSQLSFSTTSTGAQIEYRGHVITLTSADGQPLSLSDVFPNGLSGGDHYDYYPSEDEEPIPDPAPGPDPDILPPDPTPDDGDNGYDRPSARPTTPDAFPFDLNAPDAETPTDSTPGISFEGNHRRDTFTGTSRDDTIRGFDGHDVLYGGGGHDLIDGGEGRDQIMAGEGDDTVMGGAGGDAIYGLGGNDFLIGDAGRDVLIGGDGNDTLIGGEGNDELWAGAGDDVVYGVEGRNNIGLGDGDDWARGGSGVDNIFGGKGDDTIFGGDSNDVIGGGRGNDYLSGGNGNDALFGKDGADWLEGGEGHDALWCGADDDVAYGGGGNDAIRGTTGNDSLYGEEGNDAIWGGTDDDLISGGEGNDWLSGESGDDFIFGGAGDDTLRGGQGTDQLWGGSGADVFEFFGSHDTGWVMDFDPSEGDILRLDDAIWTGLGELTATQVVERFGSIDELGNLVLDFTDFGGAVIVLDGFDDMDALAASLQFM